MKLIIGLGNYPKEYEFTRHNVGFLAVKDFCKKNSIELNQEKFNGLFCKTEKYIIGLPYTYMNLSGDFVSQLLIFYKLI